jgi:hypothetical protein
MNWMISDPEHLLGAIRVSLNQGGDFLKHRLAPTGPILREPNLNYVYKASWGMHAAGVDHQIIARVLDWVEENALQSTGDFFFPGEGPQHKDNLRVYRPLTFGKVAAWIDHPLIRKPLVIDRILQYQHQPSGGVFNYIGDDPGHIEEQPTIGCLVTSFFGHLMVALDYREQAIAAGDWCRRFVTANRDNMRDGRLYSQVTPFGDLITDVAPGERLLKVVDNRQPKQEFWQVGTTMAYLCVLYDVMLSRWGYPEDEATPYLDSALELLEFEATMPLDTYLWPSKCKVAWGAGELLRVLVEYDKGDQVLIDKAYRVAERVAIFTFMENQLPDGGWSCMHYPLSERAPEVAFNYRPLKGLVDVPQRPITGSQSIFLPGEEITGEFLGEMKSVEHGVSALLETMR